MFTGAGAGSDQVPKKVPKVPEKVCEAVVQRQAWYGLVQQDSGDPEKVPGSIGAKPSSTGFRRRFQKRFRRRSGRVWWRDRSHSTGIRRRFGRFWCRARSGSTGFRRKFPEKVRFNRVSIKVPGKDSEALVQSRVRFNTVPKKVSEKV